jgi:hypothetical protein
MFKKQFTKKSVQESIRAGKCPGCQEFLYHNPLFHLVAADGSADLYLCPICSAAKQSEKKWKKIIPIDRSKILNGD